MGNDYRNEPMLDVYIFETSQSLEELEDIFMKVESENLLDEESINQIFRLMHTIKGSSAMMLFNNISSLAHSIEDLFFLIRENESLKMDLSKLIELAFSGIDFIKVELEKIKNMDDVDGDSSEIVEEIKEYLSLLKKTNPAFEDKEKEVSTRKSQYYIAPTVEKKILNKFSINLFFEKSTEMENIRSYMIIQDISDFCQDIRYFPEDIIENESSIDILKDSGFQITLLTEKDYDYLKIYFENALYVDSFTIKSIEEDDEISDEKVADKDLDLKINTEEPKLPNIEEDPIVQSKNNKKKEAPLVKQNLISIDVEKMNILMDLVGEMVISESMVTQHPEIRDLDLKDFYKAAQRLNKITNEIQDVVMSIRMVPLSNTFMKMKRIVRDMSKQLNKDVVLELIGESTEVDKNIIEHISDPLMHIIRNAIDHGIEDPSDRIDKGKEAKGRVTLEAKNAGKDVLITVKDDGKGLNKEKILKKALDKKLIKANTEGMSDSEIYNLILIPGFSTNENVTEFSGRGVGMDVVSKGIEKVGGSISVTSEEDFGTSILLKIPLTLAIIDGMNVKVGNSKYTIPIDNIRESFIAKREDLIMDVNESEMVMIRGDCYPILKLYSYYNLKTDIKNITDGILVMVGDNNNLFCILVDELLGQQQVVVKTLPEYIKITRDIKGISGCTFLGDGSISLIIDTESLYMNFKKE